MPELPNVSQSELILETDIARVHRAQYRGRSVLIKLNRNEYPTSDEIQLMEQEFQILDRLQNAGTVTSRELHRNGNRLYLILDDPGGPTLREWLQRKNFNLKDILQLAIAITAALRELHLAGYIHNNLKPESIYLDNDIRHAYLADLALSVAIDGEKLDSRQFPPERLGLSYCAPEQTGRIEHSLNTASDLYCLGAILYEMCCGRPPFENDSELGLMHDHIAREPQSMQLHNPDLPDVLDHIVARLLKKSPEERYQSALGLLSDLRECYQLYENNNGQITYFQIGVHDRLREFHIPDFLVGREAFLSQLEKEYSLVRNGAVRLVNLEGEPGLGKTRLAMALQEHIIVQNDFFLFGKFDELKRKQPYSGLILAFESWIRSILVKPPELLQEWQTYLNSELGEGATFLCEVLPSLHYLLGLERPHLSGDIQDSRVGERFRSEMVQLTQLIVNRKHNLLLFLDDLQWIDPPSLIFLYELITSPKLRHCLILLGTQPDRAPEISDFFAHVEEYGFETLHIRLRPWTQSQILDFLEMTLQIPRNELEHLSVSLQDKSGGNPLHLINLMRSLFDEGLLEFRDKRWHWDLNQIQDALLSDDLVALMMHRLDRLPVETRALLFQAACLGMKFYIDTLSGIVDRDETYTIHQLIPAFNEGMLLFHDDNASFAHDRLRQAAYYSLNKEEREQTHYRAGLFLLADTAPADLEKRIFVITDHLNHGSRFMQSKEERLRLTNLNLQAGKRASRASAVEQAHEYFQLAIQYLPENCWQEIPAISLEAHELLAGSEYHIHNYQSSIDFFLEILPRMQSLQDRTRIIEQLVPLFILQNKMSQAIQLAQEHLENLGLRGLKNTLKPLVWWRLRNLDKRLQQIGQFKDAELDTHETLIQRLLMHLAIAGMLSDPNQAVEPVCLLVEKSIQFGLAQTSAFALAVFALILQRADFPQENIDWISKQAASSMQIPAARNLRGRTQFVLITNLPAQQHSIDRTRTILQQNIRDCLRISDFHFAHLIANSLLIQYVLHGERPERLHAQMNYLGEIKEQLNLTDNGLSFDMWRQALAHFQDTGDAGHFFGAILPDSRCILRWQQHESSIHLFTYHFLRILLFIHIGKTDHHDLALQHLKQARSYLDQVKSNLLEKTFLFYESLLYIRIYYHRYMPYAVLRQIRKNHVALQKKFTKGGMIFSHRHKLIEAHLMARRSRERLAMQLFDTAIEDALQNQSRMEAALCCYEAANYHAANQSNRIAHLYARDAVYHYNHIGYYACSRNLSDRFFLNLEIDTNQSNDIDKPRTGTDQSLDFKSIQQASRSLSEEIMLPRLIERLMRILLETAGATRCIFLQDNSGNLTVLAATEVENPATQLHLEYPVPINEFHRLPRGLIHFVARTRQTVVIDHAGESELMTHEAYFQEFAPRSVLCIPLVHHARLSGIIYLENHLVDNAFHSERKEIIEMLAAQAAISFDNSTLYESLEVRVADRTHELNQALEEVNSLKEKQDSDYFLTSLLIQPLTGNRSKSETLQIDFFLRQKKQFRFRRWNAEIGGDMNLAGSLNLTGIPHTVFLNLDAMGKSLQGAAGTLVLGAVFESILGREQRLQASQKNRQMEPEEWLLHVFSEISEIFAGFSGYMMITLILGLVDDSNGKLYYICAEHPPPVLYRNGKAEFIKPHTKASKLGMPGVHEMPTSCDTIQLQLNDILICGTDGRDDLAMGEDDRGNTIMNEDEDLFRKIVTRNDGDIKKIAQDIQSSGSLTDDLALLRLHYHAGHKSNSEYPSV